MAQHRTKESRPRQGEVLIYKPAEGKGEIYGGKEGKTYKFDLKSSPGLNPDLLKPGIPVTYVTVHSDDGARAVEVQLEEAGSLETRLRSTRKRLGTKASRPAGMQAPSVVIPSLPDVAKQAAGEADEGEPEGSTEGGEDDSAEIADGATKAEEAAEAEAEAPEAVEAEAPEDAATETEAPEDAAAGTEAAETDAPATAAAETEAP
ncbi:MAG: hypothetical protein DCC49_05985 [Acidobacteria bacterium]|nr:MAG: hypothetical protein DCC49_05985 [Acidobacteriota bacterium]